MTTATAPAHRRARTASSTLTSTGALLRFYLRLDRVRLLVWVLGLTLLNVSTAAAFPSLYPDDASRQARAAVLEGNPASIAFTGPGFGFEDYTFGAMMTNEMLGFMAVLVAIMAVLLVVRHTRADEEAGRTELVRAGVVGRHAPMTAALAIAIMASFAVGGLSAVGLGGLGLDGMAWQGSLLYGAALTAVGLVFTGVGVVAAQVTEHARTASGIAGMAIGASFALRAVSDIGENALRWLSPIGWAQQTGAYVLDRWWPLLLAVGMAALLVVTAVLLTDRRDVGAGLVAARPGRSAAAPSLGSPLGLAVRLQRGSVIGWLASLVAFGALYGALMNEVESFAEDNAMVQDFLPEAAGAAMVDAFLALIVSMIAMLAAIFAAQAVLRIRSEETSGRAEPVLATAVSRVGWAAPHVVIAVVASALVTLAAGAALGASGALVLGWASAFTDSVAAAAVNLPALLVVIGVATALVGWLPRLASLTWLLVGWSIGAGLLGGLLGLPDWAMRLSPFAHVPAIPADDLTWTPLIVLTAIGTTLIALGLAGLRRRDISSA